ncbi:hypothetical protein MKC88_15020 [[Clostridium] innocuum]|nr:hypothetical protein [[Clostridium] innocuum]
MNYSSKKDNVDLNSTARGGMPICGLNSCQTACVKSCSMICALYCSLGGAGYQSDNAKKISK